MDYHWFGYHNYAFYFDRIFSIKITSIIKAKIYV